MSKATGGTKIVRWTEEEQQFIAEHAAAIKLHEGLGELDSYRSAQQLLPAERKRNLSTLALVHKDLRQLFRDQLRIQQQREAEAIRNHSKRQAAEEQTIVVTHEEPSRIEPTQEPSSLEQAVNELAELFAERFALALQQGIVRAVQQSLPELRRRIVEAPVEEPRAEKQQMLIVGLLPAQAETVKKRFGHRLDLRFVSSQEAPQMISSRLGNSSKIVLMTNFINHAHQNTALQLRPRSDVVLVQGGVSNLTRELETLTTPRSPSSHSHS